MSATAVDAISYTVCAMLIGGLAARYFLLWTATRYRLHDAHEWLRELHGSAETTRQTAMTIVALTGAMPGATFDQLCIAAHDAIDRRRAWQQQQQDMFYKYAQHQHQYQYQNMWQHQYQYQNMWQQRSPFQ